MWCVYLIRMDMAYFACPDKKMPPEERKLEPFSFAPLTGAGTVGD